MPLMCPTCGSRNLRPSQCRDFDERLNALRFIDRMELNGWTGKIYHPSGWLKFKVFLGAHKWRCEYCRVNFASFRNRKEAFTFGRWRKRW